MFDAALYVVGALGAVSGRVAPILPGAAHGLVLEVDGARLIDRVDLRLATPGVTVIMGPNGAGKSLLLRLLHGMISPTAGRITWGGAPLSESVRARQAMVFQRPVLLRRSVAANVDFVLKLRGNAASDRRDFLLDHVGLGDHAALPARLLSGGEQQRLALARALAIEPEVLFLDEPTASLDPASMQRIEQIVGTASRNGTKVVFVTHEQSQAKRLADDVVFIHRGRVLEHTAADRFFDRPESDAARDYLSGRILL